MSLTFLLFVLTEDIFPEWGPSRHYVKEYILTSSLDKAREYVSEKYKINLDSEGVSRYWYRVDRCESVHELKQIPFTPV